jgi:hypothetical protein
MERPKETKHDQFKTRSFKVIGKKARGPYPAVERAKSAWSGHPRTLEEYIRSFRKIFTCYEISHQTVWYAFFNPGSNMRLEANTFGSNDDSNGTLQSRVRFDATAGTTYYFVVASFFPVSLADPVFNLLVFNLLQGPPPLTIGS